MIGNRILSLVTAVLLALAYSSSPVRADSQEEAKRLYRQGKKLYQRGRFARAVEAFEKAYKLRPHRILLFNIALSYAMLKKPIKAGIYTRRFLREARGGERDLPPVLRRAMQLVGVLVIQVPDARARIFVDGKLAGTVRVEQVVVPGSRKVTIRLAGRVVAERTITVQGGEQKTWEITTLKQPESRRPPPRRRVSPPPPPPPKRPGLGRVHWAWFTTVAAVAVGAAAGAAVMSMKTKQAHDDFLADRTRADLREDGIMFERTANALWGVTAAAGAAAVLLAIFTRWHGAPERATSLRVTPLLGPQGVGVGLTLEY